MSMLLSSLSKEVDMIVDCNVYTMMLTPDREHYEKISQLFCPPIGSKLASISHFSRNPPE